ncbi:hypothetical protein ACM5Q9_08165 [Advenella sp. RU8]|uniref:hypothetical protein n=1 Tax=Advenella sp. RU8 TaxID=3399575 RepID=UPI003AB08E7F
MNVITRFFLLMSFVLLGACSPEYDWRSVNTAEGNLTALFPARPVEQTRQVELDGEKMPFTMQIATVSDEVYAVGYRVFPVEMVAEQAKIEQKGRALMASVYYTMGEPMPDPAPAFGEIFSFYKGVNGKVFNVHVKILAANGIIAQAYVAADNQAPAEQVRQFLDGVKIN